MPDTVNGVVQKPLAGKSFADSFADPGTSGRSEQYFEILSNRSVYEDGWKANAQHTLPWRQDLAPGNWDKDRWELYNLDEDFSEANDLAAEQPDKLAAMKAKFDDLAETYHVYPLDDRGAARLVVPKPPAPGSNPEATRFTYYAGATRLPETAAPRMKNRSWTLTADLKTDGSKTNGVIMGFGGVAAGMTFYLKNGVPIFDYNYFEDHTVIKGDKPVPDGQSRIELAFDYAGGGEGKGGKVTIKVDGTQVAQGDIPATVAARFGVDPFDIGQDSGQPVTFDYKPPFKFDGEIGKVVIDLKS